MVPTQVKGAVLNRLQDVMRSGNLAGAPGVGNSVGSGRAGAPLP